MAVLGAGTRAGRVRDVLPGTRPPRRSSGTVPGSGSKGRASATAPTTRFPSGTSTTSCPGCWRTRRGSTTRWGSSLEFDQRMLAWVAQVRGGARSSGGLGEFVMLDHLVHEMRLFKSKAEIGVMSKAAAVSAAAHERAMRICRPGMSEYQIEAELLPRVHPGGVPGCSVSVHRGRWRQRMHAALHQQHGPAAGSQICCSSTRAPSSTTTPPTSPGRFP